MPANQRQRRRNDRLQPASRRGQPVDGRRQRALCQRYLDISVWQAIGSRNGGETVSIDW